MVRQIVTAFRLMLLFTILTGLLYPGIVTVLGQLFFPGKAQGSLVERNGQVIGSHLIGQEFSQPWYFHPRPSAAGASGYDASRSGGSNLSTTNRELFKRLKADAKRFRTENPDFHGDIPTDILTTSGSGLDPHISPASADAQIGRVAGARRVDPDAVARLIGELSEKRFMGLIGEPRINVLELNLVLDQRFPTTR